MRKYIALLLVGMFAFAATAFADSAGDITSRFTATDGKTLYEQNCQSCHMPGGVGAKGAGMYPALADNQDVTNPMFTANIINNGLRGMPAFSADYDNVQIAAIANYVASHFGNKAVYVMTPEDAQMTRPEKPIIYQD